MVATHLAAVAPDGKIPDEGAREELKGQIEDLLEEVDQATDLDEIVQHLLTTRLSQVLEAIEHVRIGGPNAVRFATEALIGAIDVQRSQTWRSKTGKRVAMVLGAVWFAFSAGPTVQNSLEAWSDVFHGELDSGISQSAAPKTPDPEDPAATLR